MTDSAVASTDLPDSHEAGLALGAEIVGALGDAPPDALIVFASSRYDYSALLSALTEVCRPSLLIGCSSAGEFSSTSQGESSASAIALRSSTLHFNAVVGRGLRRDRRAAAGQIVDGLVGLHRHDFIYRSALVLTDALAGHADELVEHLTIGTAGMYQFVGAGAGDDARFQQTHIFCGTEAVADAAVVLEILSNTPVGIGVRHGWRPIGEPLRVTEANGVRLVSLNALPAAEMFQAHARESGEQFDLADPLPYFLHHVLGIETESGYRLRVPLSVDPDGSILFAAEVPVGATVSLMGTTSRSAAEAASGAVAAALAQLQGQQPAVGLFFDCVATRLRMGQDFGLEIESLQRALGSTRFAGCNSYGQIARADGQFGGFHNCTAVVCVLPK